MAQQPSVPKAGKLAGKSVAFVGKFSYGERGLAAMQILVAEEGGVVVDDPLQSAPDFLVVGGGVGGNPPAAAAKIQKKHPQVQSLDPGGLHRLVLPSSAEFLELMCSGRDDYAFWNTLRERSASAGVVFDLAGADLRGKTVAGNFFQVDFEGADFRDAKISATFERMRGADFDGAALTGGSIRHAEDCTFRRATVKEVHWNSAVFARCDFSDAELHVPFGIHATAVGCVFARADLRRSEFAYSKFVSADFRDANLAGAKLEKCDFTGADLAGADLTGADLRNALFTNADLRNAKFNDAFLGGATFAGAVVDGADFAGANLAGIDPSTLDLAKVKNFAPKEARAAGPDVLALAQTAAASEQLVASIQVRLGEQEYVELRLGMHRYGPTPTIGGGYVHHRPGGAAAGGLVGATFEEAMLNLADLWSKGTPDFDTVKIDAKKCPLRGKALQNLAVAAWREACGLKALSAEEMQEEATRRAAEDSTFRQKLLAELHGGSQGVAAWNARPETERSKLGKLRKHDFSSALLEGADLSSRDLEGNRFAGANLKGARLRQALLKGADFTGADLNGADLTGTKAADASFEGAVAKSSNFLAASFVRCNFRDADLTESDFSQSDLCGADFRGANLTRVDLHGAKFDEKTLFPSGFALPSGLDWKGAGPAPGTPAPPPPKPSGSLSFDDFLKLLGGKVDLARMQKAGSMLKAERFQLFAEVKEDRLLGIVKSQSSSELVYSCRLTSEGKFGCCTQNLRPCGGLRGALCKHLLVLIVGLAKAEQLDSATVDHWIDLSRRQKPAIEEEEMSATFLRHKGAEAGEIDWRPTETIPEDFYSM